MNFVTNETNGNNFSQIYVVCIKAIRIALNLYLFTFNLNLNELQ